MDNLPTPNTKPQEKVLTGVKKRTQIEATNKNIFVWLAVTSVVISFSLVALQFLFRELMFNQKVINEKSATSKTLTNNIEAGKQLTEKINALIANEALSSVQRDQTDPNSSTLNVILDALPVEGDATSFANSLQNTVFQRSGVGVRELSTLVEQSDLGASETAELNAATTEALQLPFKAGLTGTYEQMRSALDGMSLSIRPINPTVLTLRATDDGNIQADVSGFTYYMPARTVDIREKVLKP